MDVGNGLVVLKLKPGIADVAVNCVEPFGVNHGASAGDSRFDAYAVVHCSAIRCLQRR